MTSQARAARSPAKLAVALLALLLLSSPFFEPASSAAGPPVNWTTMNSDQHHTNYVAQSQIGPSNVNDLEQAWSFPFQLSANVPGLNVTGQGAISPPLVVNGTVYLVTNFLKVYAIDGQNGSLLWSYAPTLNTTGLPLGPLTGHMHGINYYQGDIWVSLPDCSVVALDAATGAQKMKISDICRDIPGNAGYYDSSGVPPVLSGDTLIWTSSVSEGTNVGRGFVAAYNITDGSLLWRWYVAPPAGGDPSWDADSCSPPCHGNVAPYAGDWGAMGMPAPPLAHVGSLAGAGPSFGDPVVDPRLGVVFVSTSQPSPDWNGTYRPGPDLYSDSIVALNITDGRMLWFYQTTPHDLYDFDCGWNAILGNVTTPSGTQEAVFKGCKNGYVYALGASSGKLLWYFDPPSVRRSSTGNADYASTDNYSATLPWANYPSTDQFTQCPGQNGAIESDMALAGSRLYVATYNLCTYVIAGQVQTEGGSVTGVNYSHPDYQGANTTIYAIDTSTGKAVWSYGIPRYGYRGWLTASNGLVFAGSPDGYLRALSAGSGSDVYNLNVGTPLYDSPTIGSARDGRVYLYQLVGAASIGAFAGPVPGGLLAFTVPPPPSSPWQPLLVVGLVAVVSVAGLVLYTRGRRASRPGRGAR